MIEVFFETWFESVRERRLLPASDRFGDRRALEIELHRGLPSPADRILILDPTSAERHPGQWISG